MEEVQEAQDARAEQLRAHQAELLKQDAAYHEGEQSANPDPNALETVVGSDFAARSEISQQTGGRPENVGTIDPMIETASSQPEHDAEGTPVATTEQEETPEVEPVEEEESPEPKKVAKKSQPKKDAEDK